VVFWDTPPTYWGFCGPWCRPVLVDVGVWPYFVLLKSLRDLRAQATMRAVVRLLPELPDKFK